MGASSVVGEADVGGSVVGTAVDGSVGSVVVAGEVTTAVVGSSPVSGLTVVHAANIRRRVSGPESENLKRVIAST